MPAEQDRIGRFRLHQREQRGEIRRLLGIDLIDHKIEAELLGERLGPGAYRDVERIVRRAIADYEPRLLPDTVTVLPLMKDGAHDQYNVLLFEIRAMINLKPYPLELTVQSSVDLETSRMSISDASRSPRHATR